MCRGVHRTVKYGIICPPPKKKKILEIYSTKCEGRTYVNVSDRGISSFGGADEGEMRGVRHRQTDRHTHTDSRFVRK